MANNSSDNSDILSNISIPKHGIFLSNVTDALTNLEDNAAYIEVLKNNLNATFLVVTGLIVMFMQAGFGFLEAGSIRAKNTTNILIKNFADLTFGNKHH